MQRLPYNSQQNSNNYTIIQELISLILETRNNFIDDSVSIDYIDKNTVRYILYILLPAPFTKKDVTEYFPVPNKSQLTLFFMRYASIEARPWQLTHFSSSIKKQVSRKTYSNELKHGKTQQGACIALIDLTTEL